MGSAGWQLPHKQAQPGAAYQVSGHSATVLAELPGSRNAGSSCHQDGALNFSEAQIKRSAHVG